MITETQFKQILKEDAKVLEDTAALFASAIKETDPLALDIMHSEGRRLVQSLHCPTTCAVLSVIAERRIELGMSDPPDKSHWSDAFVRRVGEGKGDRKPFVYDYPETA